MIIGSIKEQSAEEPRTSLTPAVTKMLVKAGYTVMLEKDIGTIAGFSDEEYQTAGAKLTKAPDEIYKTADLITQITPPSPEYLTLLTPKRILVSDFRGFDLAPYREQSRFIRLESVPRTSVAQSVDILSAQSTVRGYAAALYALSKSPRLAPQLMTAAASIKAAEAVVIGASVAGLQAASVLKRQGCIVTILDINDKNEELAKSVGAGFSMASAPDELADLITGKSFLLAAASAPNGTAPKIISKNLLPLLKNKAVIVDTTAGNIEIEEKIKTTPSYHFYRNTAAERLAPLTASVLWANNMYNLITLLDGISGTPVAAIPEYIKSMYYPPDKLTSPHIGENK